MRSLLFMLMQSHKPRMCSFDIYTSRICCYTYEYGNTCIIHVNDVRTNARIWHARPFHNKNEWKLDATSYVPCAFHAKYMNAVFDFAHVHRAYSRLPCTRIVNARGTHANSILSISLDVFCIL